jgi:misacylated tRNA(Ala) deacylase
MTEILFRDDAYLDHCEARVTAAGPDGIRLDRSIFYPEGGGQPGDTGTLELADGKVVEIVDTRKDRATGEILHVPAAPAEIAPGAVVTARIDWARRHRLMRMHTCLHLLSAVVVAPVTGGAVADGSGRLDFDLPESPDREEVEARLNAMIAAGAAVGTRWITDEELDARPELVKTMSVAPPRGVGRVRLVEIAGIDLQPCGGTHVADISEIGAVKVTKIEKKGRQNRRIRLALSQ